MIERHIALPHVENTLFAKTLTMQLRYFLKYGISEDKTGVIKDKDISQLIRETVIKRTRDKKINIFQLASIDQKHSTPLD